MNFLGLFNLDYSFGINNWFIPSNSFNFNPFINFSFPSHTDYQFPLFNFSYNFWNHTPTYSFPPIFSYNETTELQPKKTKTYEEKNVTKTKDNSNLDGYNASAGKKLASIALNNHVGWTGYCARHVKNAISAANLGSYKMGHAYQMPSILRNNKNFKEIPTDTVDVKDLPAGCILVYDKGKEGYSRDYGHTEITTGDGRAVSDGITQNLHKKPSAIFMPVEHNYLA